MKNLLFIVSVLYSIGSLSQKIDGVYYGNIVSQKNAIIIKSNGERMGGVIYLNENDTIHFSGVFSQNIFTTTLHLKDQHDVSLVGYPEKNAIWLKVLPDSNRRFLNKISGKANYKVKRLYAEDMDPMLLGRWESFKSVTKNGGEGGKLSYTYSDDHRMSMKLLSAPAGVTRGDGGNNTQIKGLEYIWGANGYEMTRKFVFPAGFSAEAISRIGPPPVTVSVYAISHDTLTIYGSKGGYTVFKKK